MILPAIIPRSLDDLKENLEKLSFARLVQIDVVDGKFDDDISWPYSPQGAVKDLKLKDRDAQIDLMISHPINDAREWLLSGAKSLVFHLESLEAPAAAINLRKDFDFGLGFAIGNDTPLESLYPWIDKLDFVQLMGIREIGSQGQPFDARVIERVAALRHLYPKLIINIDGGMNEDTIKELKKAGADNFVVGSVILRAQDPKQKYEELLKIIDQV